MGFVMTLLDVMLQEEVEVVHCSPAAPATAAGTDAVVPLSIQTDTAVVVSVVGVETPNWMLVRVTLGLPPPRTEMPTDWLYCTVEVVVIDWGEAM